jgi:hypothetical protein
MGRDILYGVAEFVQIMTQLVERATPLNMKTPTASTWHHQRRAITISLTMNLVIAWR